MENFTSFQTERKLKLKPRATNVAPKNTKTFLHVDLDAFFASVEQIKDKKLRGKPLIVGGRNSRRGVVASASYEAKRFGVKTGMPWQQAKRLCPEAICVPADFEAYSYYSDKVQAILGKMAPVVAQASVDESYLDMTGCERIYGTAIQAAEKIHKTVRRKTGLNLSIGVAGSLSVAKMASAMAKPCGLLAIPKGAERLFLYSLPVQAMPGIGPKIGSHLKGMGIQTLGQLARMPPDLLRTSFGVYGPYLRAKARGEDTWDLEVTEVIKSIGKQRTFENDISDWNSIQQELFELIELVGKKLREKDFHARAIHVQVRYFDFTSEGTSITLRDPSCFDRVLFNYASKLMEPLVEGKKPVRLIGFCAKELVQRNPQLDLFRTPKAARWDRFYSGVDSVRKRFGLDALKIKH